MQDFQPGVPAVVDTSRDARCRGPGSSCVRSARRNQPTQNKYQIRWNLVIDNSVIRSIISAVTAPFKQTNVAIEKHSEQKWRALRVFLR